MTSKLLSNLMIVIVWIGLILNITSPFMWFNFYTKMYPKIAQFAGFEPIVAILLAMLSISIMLLTLVVCAGFLAIYHKEAKK